MRFKLHFLKIEARTSSAVTLGKEENPHIFENPKVQNNSSSLSFSKLSKIRAGQIFLNAFEMVESIFYTIIFNFIQECASCVLFGSSCKTIIFSSSRFCSGQKSLERKRKKTKVEIAPLKRRKYRLSQAWVNHSECPAMMAAKL